VLQIPPKDITMHDKPFANGGFGEVYRAKWYQKRVVVKVIKALDEEEKEEVIKEVNITFRLRHPNVVDLFGITQVNSWQIGIVMEEAEHGSLNIWIGKIDHQQLTKIALGIVVGLEYVHSQNVMHRDVKPKNILMFGPKDAMIPKIADFGSAKMIERVTKNTKVGEDYYMAPEVEGRLYGYPADIFSLAVTMYEIFNEQLISEAPTEVKSFVSQAKIPKNCRVPVYLVNVIERGFNRNPKLRPALSEYRETLHG